MNLTPLIRGGYRAVRDEDSTLVEMKSCRDGLPFHETIVDAAEVGEPAASRTLLLAEAVARFINCGGTPAELYNIVAATERLPDPEPTGFEFVKSVKAGDCVDHVFRAADGSLFAVRPDVAARRLSDPSAALMLESGAADPDWFFEPDGG